MEQSERKGRGKREVMRDSEREREDINMSWLYNSMQEYN